MLEEKTPVSRLILIIVLTVVLFALSIYIGFYMGMNSVSEELVVAELQTTPMVSTSAITTSSPTDISAWKTYTNDKYGFSFMYPQNWELKEFPNIENSPITLTSPETKKIIEQNGAHGGALIFSEFQFDYYPSIADEAGNNANEGGATTIDELINKNSTLTKIGTTKLDNNPAIDLIWGGYGTNYTILSEKNNHLYKITTNSSSKNDLSGIQKEIINSFQFTK